MKSIKVYLRVTTLVFPLIIAYWGCASCSDNLVPEDYIPTAEDIYTSKQNERLGRGVNLGNALEAPAEGEWGAEWVSGSDAWLDTRWSGTSQEKQAVIQDFDQAADWAKKHNRPLYLGEFGAYRRADMDSRALWTDFVARQAEERGISWAYWEFCAGFGVYNQETSDWNYPILKALIP